MKINRLTDEQRDRVVHYRDQWLEIGLCTDPADRPRAEAAIAEMYRQAGLTLPAKIVWCGSPLAMVADHHAVAVEHGQGGDNVAIDVLDDVWDNALASVRTHVGWHIQAAIYAAIVVPLADGVAAVRDAIAEGMLTDDRIIHGAHTAATLAFFRYFHDVLGLAEQTSKLNGLWELAQSAGWVMAHENICWVSERHNVLKRDDQGWLHSLDGPACSYPDGFAVYSIHGRPARRRRSSVPKLLDARCE